MNLNTVSYCNFANNEFLKNMIEGYDNANGSDAYLIIDS